MRTIVIVCAVVLGFASLGGVAAAANKVAICHFQEENDSWKLLSVGQPAAGAHLEHHDDALPGGTTSQTSTVLDAECAGVTAICPCAASGSARKLHRLFLRQEFDGEPETVECLEGAYTSVTIIDSGDEQETGPILGLSSGLDEFSGIYFCVYQVLDADNEFITLEIFQGDELQPGEVEACREDIRKSIAKLDDCPTP